MRCKKIRELILTDYLDDQMKGEEKAKTIAEMKTLSEELKKQEEELARVEEEWNQQQLFLPAIPLPLCTRHPPASRSSALSTRVSGRTGGRSSTASKGP